MYPALCKVKMSIVPVNRLFPYNAFVYILAEQVYKKEKL